MTKNCIRSPKIATFLMLLLALTVISNTAGAQTNTSNNYTCLSKKQIDPSVSAFDLYNGLVGCILSKDYEQGAYLFALAGSTGKFDAHRVADKTAHQAPNILSSTILNSERANEFKEYLLKTLSNDSKRAEYCIDLKKRKAPTYYPTYMINHGMAAMSAAMDGQPQGADLIPLNSPQKTWMQSIDEYLTCPKP